jgi:uncharacterized membrane protein (DUF373 family)
VSTICGNSTYIFLQFNDDLPFTDRLASLFILCEHFTAYTSVQEDRQDEGRHVINTAIVAVVWRGYWCKVRL